MTSAQNHLQRLNGSKLWFFLLTFVFLTACEALKPVATDNKKPDNTELDEIAGKPKPKPTDGNANTDKPKPKPTDGNANTDKPKPKPTDGNANTDKPKPKPTDGNANTDKPKPKPTDGNANTDKPKPKPTDGNANTDKPKPTDTKTDTAVPRGEFKPSYKVGIVMPFFATEVSTASTMPRSALQGMNFYEGALLALQQLSAEGVNLDVEVFDSRRSTAVVQGLVDNYKLAGLDLIIGPAASENIEIVAEQVAKKGVPMVSLNLKSSPTDKSPYFIQASPYFESHAAATVRYVRDEYRNKRVILVLPSDDKTRLAAYQDANALYGNRLNIQTFYAEKTSETAYKFTGLNEKLSIGDTSVVICPVTDETFVGSLLRTLGSVRTQRPTVVFGMPNWTEFEKIDFGTLENANIHVTNASYVSAKSEKVKAFKREFFSAYAMPPTLEAYKGYDLTLYFGRMLDKHGTGFLEKLEQSNANLLQTSFNFERDTESYTDADGLTVDADYFENKFVYILRLKNHQFVPVNSPKPAVSGFDD